MKDIKQIFNETYEYARMYSTCNKVNVGCVFIDTSGKKYYGSNCNYNDPEGMCTHKDECYKAKVSGIYESTEETRHLCKANHAEVTLISWMNSIKTRNKFDRENGEFFVTRYPCYNCAKLLCENGFKKVRYCGRQEISDDVKQLFEEYNVDVKWYPEFDYEGDSVKDYEWWTNKFYDKAYDIVKDRKFPVTIPGYNRPELPTLKNLGVENFDDEYNWEFIVIVRESQEEMYKEATKQYKYVTIKSFPDDVINNAGAVRRTTQKWLNSQGIKATFQMDDDVQYLGYSFAGHKENGYPKSQYRRHKYEGLNTCKVLAMWQIAMEYAMAKDNVMISCGQQIAFSWKDDYCQSRFSYEFMRGPMTQVVCFNIEGLCKEGIYHRNNSLVGFDDIDFTINVIESGNSTCCFPFIVYGVEALGGGNGDKVSEERLKERFKENQEKLKALHSDKSYVKFRPKRGLDQVCLSWINARKHYAKKNNLDECKIVNNTIHNIWRDGKLLKEAKENNYE